MLFAQHVPTLEVKLNVGGYLCVRAVYQLGKRVKRLVIFDVMLSRQLEKLGGVFQRAEPVVSLGGAPAVKLLGLFVGLSRPSVVEGAAVL